MAEGTVYFKVLCVLNAPMGDYSSLLHDPTPPVLQTSPALEGVQEVARASFSAESLTGRPGGEGVIWCNGSCIRCPLGQPSVEEAAACSVEGGEQQLHCKL